jgi:hypothetical protein
MLQQCHNQNTLQKCIFRETYCAKFFIHSSLQLPYARCVFFGPMVGKY